MARKGKPNSITETERFLDAETYREPAVVRGSGAEGGGMRKPGNIPPQRITQTTRYTGGNEYANEVYPGEGGTTVYGQGQDGVEAARAQEGHRLFKEGLMQNVNGYRFKNNDKHDGSMHNMNEYIGEIGYNPAVSEKQRKFFGAELGRAKRGEATQTGMGKSKLREFAKRPRGGY